MRAIRSVALILTVRAGFGAFALYAADRTRSIPNLLPPDAKIIETATVNAGNGDSRTLALWMLRPKKVVRQEFMGCSDDVYGDHWIGPTRLSVVDLAKKTVLNTVEIRSADNAHDDFSIPFLVSKYFYHVPRPNNKNEGTPKILDLADLTGEGVAGQFVLFDYEACGIAMTSVFGYSPHTDKAVQYRVELSQDGDKRQSLSWISHTFGEKSIRPGSWRFTWEPGHGADAWINEEVTFDSATQVFVDHMTVKLYPELAHPATRNQKQRKL